MADNRLFWMAAEHMDQGRLAEMRDNPQPLDPERRAFLEGALKSVTYDVAGKMREALEILNRPGAPADDKCGALEDLQFECERADAANDLNTLGGLVLVLQHTEDSNAEVRMNAFWVLATCLQHNEKVQAQVMEKWGVKKLVHAAASEQNNGALQKALLALSAMVRHNKAALEQFAAENGFAAVGELCLHEEVRIRRKAVWLIYSILFEAGPEASRGILVDRDLCGILSSALDLECGRGGNFDVDVVTRVLETLCVTFPLPADVAAKVRTTNLPTSMEKLEKVTQSAEGVEGVESVRGLLMQAQLGVKE